MEEETRIRAAVKFAYIGTLLSNEFEIHKVGFWE